MNYRYFISLLLAILLFGGLYATPDYILGTGTGDSFESAFANAQMQIAQQISVRVQGVSEMKSLDIETDGKVFYSTSIEKSIRLSVDRTITGIEVLSRSEKKGVFEVNAGLDKSKLINSLKGELDLGTSSALRLVLDAKAMAEQGKPLIAVKNYTDAQALIPDIYAQKSIYDSFAGNAYTIPAEITIPALESGMRDLISRIGFKVVSGDGQSAPEGLDLPLPVVFMAQYQIPAGGTVPIAGFPVKVSYGDDSLIDKGQTDSDGLFRVKVKAHRLTGQNQVMIRSDAFNLPAHLSRLASNAVAVALYQVQSGEKIELAVKVSNERGQRLDNVERLVAKSLSGTSFVISEKADLELTGIVSVDNVKLVEGFAAPSYVANVRVDIQLKRRSTAMGLGSFSASGTGMSAKGEDEAIRDAYGKISINSRKFSSLLLDWLQAE